MSNQNNASFYTFKPRSGKWKYHGRGVASPSLFKAFTVTEQRQLVLFDNGGCVPGTSSKCHDLTIVVIPDESHPCGWPLMLPPTIEDTYRMETTGAIQ